jgi:hypothetical protein
LKLRRESKKTKILALDEDLVQAFMLLEIQGPAFGNERKLRSAELYLEGLRLYNDAVKNIPKEFKMTKEAGYIICMNVLRGQHLRSSETNTKETSFEDDLSSFEGITSSYANPAISPFSSI